MKVGKVVPDVLKAPYNLAKSFVRKGVDRQEAVYGTITSVCRAGVAYGIYRLSARVLGEASFAAVKNNKLWATGLLAVGAILSPAATLITAGGVAIRNNLPELFKAWTAKSVNANTAWAVGGLALGALLLSSSLRKKFQVNDENHGPYDFGITEAFAHAAAKAAVEE